MTGCGHGQNIASYPSTSKLCTHLVWISGRIKVPIRPVNEIHGHGFAVYKPLLIGDFIDRLDLIAAEDERLHGIVGVLNVIDFRSHGSDNTKVVTGALHSPEEFGVLIDCDQAAVGQDDIHRDELV